MKPPAAGAKATVTSTSSRQVVVVGGSHIPLPLRKGSTKLEKSQDGENDCSEDCDRPKATSRGRRGNQERSSSSGGKMSLLGGTSFCCASGQKDDMRDSQSIPAPQNRRMKNGIVKREADGNAPESGTASPQAIAKKVATPKNRRPKVENYAVDDSSKDARQHTDDFTYRPRSDEKISPRSVASSHPSPPAHQDNRLKLPDTPEKKRSTASQHQRTKDASSAVGQRKDCGNDPETTATGKQQKYTDVLRKLRKSPAHCTPNNIMVLNIENKLYEKSVTNDKKVNDPVVEVSSSGDNTVDSNDRPKSIGEDSRVGLNTQNVVIDIQSSGTIKKDFIIGDSLSPGHVDDLDCPCCDNGDVSSSDKPVERSPEDSTSKDAVEEDVKPVPVTFAVKELEENIDSVSLKTPAHQKDDGGEDEVGALKEELQQEKLKLQSQQQRVLQLEEEVKVMEQLKRELNKEQKLRKEAEETLLEILHRGNNLDQDQQVLLKLESQHPAVNCKKPESGRSSFLDTDEDNSSLLLGYESRIRRYQLYISKLERDNLTLIRELQQFKDLSPCSQQEQAKALLGKVTQLERDNQQQQFQYECCLDEVANRLVQTLLAQKHLEEECSTLHARVEQLESENQRLLEIVHGEEETKGKAPRGSLSDESEISRDDGTDPPHSADDCATKESNSELLAEQKKRTVRESAKCFNAKNAKTCKVPPTRYQKASISEDHVSSHSFSASKIASSINKTSSRAQNNHPHILNNQIYSPTDEDLKLVLSDVSASPLSKNIVKATTTKCTSLSSVPNVSRLRSPTIHLSFKDKTSSATDDTRFTGVKRKRINRVASDKGTKELQLQGKCPNNNLGKYALSQRNRLHSENSAQMEIALKQYRKNDITLDGSFSDTDDVFIYGDNPKRLSYDAFCMFPSSTEHQEIFQEDNGAKPFSPVHDMDNSVSNDTVHRTRDEGYSTMSSDLQPDSAADTTVSEQDDHSATYIASETGQRCSDDSITECLDASMSSSSDSGFGPLYCIAGDLLSTRFVKPSRNTESQFNSESTSSLLAVKECLENQGTELHQESHSDLPSQGLTTIIPSITDCYTSQELFSHTIKVVHSSSDKSVQSTDSNNRLSTQTEISDLCEDSSNSETATIIPHRGNLKSEPDSNSCHLNNLTDPLCFNELNESHDRTEGDFDLCYQVENGTSPCEERPVLTAEKATLTEPEELMWREKALAQYIDESIWSLYSSESDIQIKYSPETFHNQPLEVPSKSCLPRSKTHNCINLSEDLNVNSNVQNLCSDTSVTSIFGDKCSGLSTENAAIEIFNNNVYDDGKTLTSQHSLERVASDTVLHLKTSFHELESSMKSSLKTSKDLTNRNIPLVHHLSISNINDLAYSMPSDRDIALESKFLQKSEKQELTVSNLWWPSPTDVIKSSSLSSLQSSLSYQAASDEMEDDDVHHISRKGSQDPDLSSASDTDYMNLDHKAFVEQWLQKEISEKNTTKNDEGSKKSAVPRNVPRKYMKQSLRSSSPNQNERNGHPLDQCLPLEDDQSLPEITESSDIQPKLQSSSLDATPNSLENYYLDEVSALYADACASYVENNNASKRIGVSLANHYPLYSMGDVSPSACRSLECETACDEYLLCPNSEDCDSQSLEPEVKAFNSDFYRLCDLGSLRSLDSNPAGRNDVVVNQEILQKQLLLSPKFARFNLRKPQEQVDYKPTCTNVDNNPNQSEQTHPVRPTSFSSPLVPCDRKSRSFSNRKDASFSICDAGISNTASRCYLHADPQCYYCEQKAAHMPSPRESLPQQKTTVNANDVEVQSKLPVRKLTISSRNVCQGGNPEARVPLSPQKKPGSSLQHRVPPRDTLSDLRSDAVSKRQQSRRERWNARRNRIKEGCGTAWIHLQTNVNFTDPNMRESLLDSVVATSSSDSSSSEDENEYLLPHNNSHLQRICREKRQKVKASGKDDVLSFTPRIRTSIVNCRDLYYRYGEQEEEAIACFDFLEDMPTTSEAGSMEIFQKSATYNANSIQYNQGLGIKGRLNAMAYNDSPSANCTLPSKPSQFTNFSSRLRLPGLWNKPLSHNMSSMTFSSQDCEFLDHISLSDSCAESYSSTPDSFEDASAS